jgi:uroporphyrinogen decarboxylase
VSVLLLDVLCGKSVTPPPLWMMRQAGRYLIEYRQLRAKAGSFWAMCNTPDYAAEVTLHPIRRFDFDAAIIFSDILVVVEALGLRVKFDEGPKLQPIQSIENLVRDSAEWARCMAPAYAAIAKVRAELEVQKALLGFAGAPWTLACYMAGGGNDEQRNARLWAYRKPEEFQKLVDLLCECIAQHLIAQLKAGADAVQLFESWALGLPLAFFDKWVVAPAAKVVAAVRAEVPEAKIIGFPRGASMQGLEHYARTTGISAISLDASVPLGWAVDVLGKNCVLQGNLDPLVLMAGGQALRDSVETILGATRGHPFVFNLGHGVLPATPVEHVAELVRLVRRAQ